MTKKKSIRLAQAETFGSERIRCRVLESRIMDGRCRLRGEGAHGALPLGITT